MANQQEGIVYDKYGNAKSGAQSGSQGMYSNPVSQGGTVGFVPPSNTNLAGNMSMNPQIDWSQYMSKPKKKEQLMSVPGEVNPITRTMNKPLPKKEPLMSIPGQMNPITNTMNAQLSNQQVTQGNVMSTPSQPVPSAQSGGESQGGFLSKIGNAINDLSGVLGQPKLSERQGIEGLANQSKLDNALMGLSLVNPAGTEVKGLFTAGRSGFNQVGKVEGLFSKLTTAGTDLATGKVILQGESAEAASGIMSKVNTKSISLVNNYVNKMVKAVKNPMVVLGILGTTLYTSLYWAPNEKGDALTTLTIAQKDAVKNGHIELAKEIDQAIKDANGIYASIPVVGFLQSEKAKYNAAMLASEANMKTAEKIVNDKADEENKLKLKEEEKAYYEQRDLEQKQYDEEKKAYYENVRQQTKERDAEQLARDKELQDYYAKRDAQQKAYQLEREAYYKKQREEQLANYEKNLKSKLKFGLL